MGGHEIFMIVWNALIGVIWYNQYKHEEGFPTMQHIVMLLIVWGVFTALFYVVPQIGGGYDW